MIKPLGDRIVIKVIEDTEQTSGGIFIPDSAKEKPQKGKILYAKYAGTDVKVDGAEYKILSVNDALAIIE